MHQENMLTPNCSSSRNLLIDFMRGIAICLVVLGHNIQYGSGRNFLVSSDFYNNSVFKLIYSFHMPLFALIAGYVFFWSLRKKSLEIFKLKILQLLLPIITWKTLELSVKGIADILERTFELQLWIKEYVNSVLFDFWFLWAIFWCSLIVLLLEKMARGKIWIYLALIVLMLLLPTKLHSYLYIYIYPYFVIGFLFNKYKLINAYQKITRYDVYVLLSSITIFIILFRYFDYDMYIYVSRISLVDGNSILNQLYIDILRWTIGFFGSIIMIILGKNICNKFKGRIVLTIAMFGKISLGIYILNFYANEYLLPQITSNLKPNIVIWFIETVISMFVYYILILVIRKNPLANKLLFGGR